MVWEVHYPWDMCRNIHQDKTVRYIVISVRVNVRKKVQLAQERVKVTMRKASGLSVQVGKLCGHRQVHGIGRFVYLSFCVKTRVRLLETPVLLLSAVSDNMGN